MDNPKQNPRHAPKLADPKSLTQRTCFEDKILRKYKMDSCWQSKIKETRIVEDTILMQIVFLFKEKHGNIAVLSWADTSFLFSLKSLSAWDDLNVLKRSAHLMMRKAEKALKNPGSSGENTRSFDAGFAVEPTENASHLNSLAASHLEFSSQSSGARANHYWS